MAKNTKQSSKEVTKLAANTLADKNASGIQKSLAASALSQSGTNKQTGADMESAASRALSNPHSADTTKTLAASVLSQANKDR